MNPFRLRPAAVLVLMLAVVPALDAQVPLSPRALGMGGALLGVARGQESLFLNPAHLGLPGTPRWSVAVPQVTLGGTLAGLSAEDLPDFVRYDDQSDARRDELLASIPDTGVELQLAVHAPLAAFQWRRFAFGVAYGATGSHALDRDLVELALQGYEQGRVDYEVRGTTGSWRTFWDMAVGYGHRIGPVSLGVTAHYLRGGTLARSWFTEPRVNLAATDIDVDYTTVLLRGGHGFALDVGAALQPHRTLTLSGAVANAFSAMQWSDELRLRTLHLTSSDIEGADITELRERYTGSERALRPDDSAALSVDARVLEEGAYLPTVARLGVGWQPATRTQLAVAYFGALTGGRLAGSWEQMLGIGVQQRIPLLTLRAGFASNLADGTMLTGGIGLGPIQVGAARVRDGRTAAAQRDGWIAALGFSTRTRSVLP